MTKEKRIKTLQNLGIIALALISLYYVNELFGNQLNLLRSAANSIILPFGIALFISYLLAPLVELIERTPIKKRIISVLIVFLIVIIIIAIFVYFIGIIIYEQGVSFVQNDWAGIVEWVNTTIENNAYLQDTYNSISEYISFENAQPVLFNVVNIVRSIGGITVVIVLTPVFLFFLLRDKHTVFNGIISVVPKKYQEHLRELGSRANDVIQKYFNGRFLSMFIMSILLSIMFFVLGFGIERSLFFGFLLGFLDIIPYIGTFIGMVLPILYSFTISDTLLMHEFTFLGLIGINAVLQGFQTYILQPYIMGKEVNMHPLLVLSSFIFFGALLGITGVILAIPITGIIRTTAFYFSELNDKKKQENKTSKPLVKKS